MKITVGIDAGEASTAAVAWLIAQPFAAKAEITLVTSFDMIVSDPLDDEQVIEATAQRIRGSLPDATVTTALADGAIPNVLDNWTHGADLLVIGASRTRHARSVLAGALPERLAAATALPIAIVPDDWDGYDGDIVVGVADDDSSDDAVAFAADLAERDGRLLRLVHFWQRTNPPTDPVSLYLAVPHDLAETHNRRLQDVADLLRARHPRLEISAASHEGYVAHAFLAPRRHASMIVVGSHRHGLISGWIAGSVVQGVMKNYRSAVCVVPPGTYSVRTGATPLPTVTRS